jgi:hypothetical protein
MNTAYSFAPPEAIFKKYSDSEKNDPSPDFMELVNNQENNYLERLLLEAWDMVDQKIGYKFIYEENDVSLNCSRFVWKLFERIGLSFPYTATIYFNEKNKNILDHFTVIGPEADGGFKPNVGDVLSFNYSNAGHMVVVVDPKNCIAVNSASWVWDSDANRTLPSEKGVRFHRIYRESRCRDGVWYSWDNSAYKFQKMLRHNAFIELN